MSSTEKSPLSQIFSLTVLVASLGYFVDMFDLLLFPIVRQPSLTALGVPPGGTTEDGMFTVLPAACVGNCHNAPTMLINGRFYDRLTPKAVDAVIAELRAGTEEPVRCK